MSVPARRMTMLPIHSGGDDTERALLRRALLRRALLRRALLGLALCAAVATGAAASAIGQEGGGGSPRARDLGVPFDGTPGRLNAITDVAGVEVGHVTLVRGDGALVVGEGPVRTGVTAIWPRGKEDHTPVFAGWFSLNGNGEMTGTTWVKESGLMEGPFMITNTLSVGVVHHGVIRWGVERWTGSVEDADGPGPIAALPVVAETWDGGLNDILGQHVTERDTLTALDTASAGAVEEGNVGGGTGMICHQFKGGIGTSSRHVVIRGRDYTLGVLVQCNYGLRSQLRIAGAPIGTDIDDLMPSRPGGAGLADGLGRTAAGAAPDDRGSIIVLVATDAPLLSHQLERLARRVGLGLGRMGSISGNGSGDIFMALSTANHEAAATTRGTAALEMLANSDMGPLFGATVEATEESIVNAMVAARTMTGADELTVHALPHDRLRALLRRYGRLVE